MKTIIPFYEGLRNGRGKRTEPLSLIEDSSKTRIPIPKASIRQSELCNGRQVLMLKSIRLTAELVEDTNMR